LTLGYIGEHVFMFWIVDGFTRIGCHGSLIDSRYNSFFINFQGLSVLGKARLRYLWFCMP
jgi:hypothetical protein